MQDFNEQLETLSLESASYRRNESVFAASVEYYDSEAAKLRVKQEEAKLQSIRNWNRPSIFLQAELFQEGDKWIASAKGVSAEGNSPEQAFLAFDNLWVGKDEL